MTSVPAAAWETSDVVKLDLSKNSIEDLPNELSLCSSLPSVFLSKEILPSCSVINHTQPEFLDFALCFSVLSVVE